MTNPAAPARFSTATGSDDAGSHRSVAATLPSKAPAAGSFDTEFSGIPYLEHSGTILNKRQPFAAAQHEGMSRDHFRRRSDPRPARPAHRVGAARRARAARELSDARPGDGGGVLRPKRRQPAHGAALHGPARLRQLRGVPAAAARRGGGAAEIAARQGGARRIAPAPTARSRPSPPPSARTSPRPSAYMPAAEFDAVVALIADAKRPLHLLGGRFTDAIARYMAAHLRILRPGVEPHRRPAGQLARPSRRFRSQGRARRLRHPPLSGGSRRIRGGRSGAAGDDRARHRPVALADRARSRRMCCRRESRSPSAWDSSAALLAVAEALIAAVTARNWPASQQRIKALERLRPAEGA